ncbi:MAG: hypothetical protein IPO01_17225 [Chitinophagaceae bacterium]|nr:hypothetical protein [Chitinophagaceae bacterium]MBL0202588.1 hypothetical protein [Chitinophagaceae bacterium]
MKILLVSLLFLFYLDTTAQKPCFEMYFNLGPNSNWKRINPDSVLIEFRSEDSSLVKFVRVKNKIIVDSFKGTVMLHVKYSKWDIESRYEFYILSNLEATYVKFLTKKEGKKYWGDEKDYGPMTDPKEPPKKVATITDKLKWNNHLGPWTLIYLDK